MPCVFIKDDFDIFHSRAAVQVDDAANTLAVFPDRVLVAGEKQQRQIARRMSEGMCRICLCDQHKQVAEAGSCENKIALFIRLVERNHAFIPAEPVKHGVGVFDFAVVALKGNIG